ncbi:MAG: S-formylglutathione hydrolase, partial [Rhodothalassiaceae bacterium]
MSRIEILSRHRCFGGTVSFATHRSEATGTDMNFAVFVPPQAAAGKVPVLTWLAGLTCTQETFMIKAGAQRLAAELGLMLVAPDTSPRGEGVPDDPEGAYDLGLGAGFYLDATEDPWSRHYRMLRYITRDLRDAVFANFPGDPDRQGIFGHSMGGHGALTIGLKHPETYRSISAFAPIAAPARCPWGEKAFTAYLGPDRAAWKDHDATEIVSRLTDASLRPKLLVDQGLADQFLEEQLHPHLFEAACRRVGYPLEMRRHAGYDHGYYFIATFMADH